MIEWFLIACAAVVFVYVSARAASFAFFRTKAEYDRRKFKSNPGENNNGV